ncbi:MAG: flagellar protein FlaG [Pseudomonadota bacterium]
MKTTNDVTSTQVIARTAIQPAVTAEQRAESKRVAAINDGQQDAAQKAAATKQESANNEALRKALQELNERGSGTSPALRFEQDDETGVVIITVTNRETGEVIRRLPPEAVIDAAGTEQSLPSLVNAIA